MTTEIPNLWPVEIKNTAVRTPLFILRHQAGLLRHQTGNAIEAEVTSQENGNLIEHSLELVVPALKRFRYELLVVSHDKAMVYPCFIRDHDAEYSEQFETANSQDQFVAKLGEYLRSNHTRAVIDSLIAQANDIGDSPAA